MALNIKSIDYEFIEENIMNKSELLIRSNPVYQNIPVLIHGEKSICESLIIVQYIDDAWTNGPSILPSDPYERALARFWAAYIDNTWFLLMKEFRSVQDEPSKTSIFGKIIEGAVLLEEAFVKCSKGKAFFGGDSIGYVDIALGSLLGILKIVGRATQKIVFDETTTPKLVAWAERFCQDPAVKDVMPFYEKELREHLEAKQEAASN